MNKEYKFEIKLGNSVFTEVIKNTQDLLALNRLIGLISDYCDVHECAFEYKYSEIEE